MTITVAVGWWPARTEVTLEAVAAALAVAIESVTVLAGCGYRTFACKSWRRPAIIAEVAWRATVTVWAVTIWAISVRSVAIRSIAIRTKTIGPVAVTVEVAVIAAIVIPVVAVKAIAVAILTRLVVVLAMLAAIVVSIIVVALRTIIVARRTVERTRLLHATLAAALATTLRLAFALRHRGLRNIRLNVAALIVALVLEVVALHRVVSIERLRPRQGTLIFAALAHLLFAIRQYDAVIMLGVL